MTAYSHATFNSLYRVHKEQKQNNDLPIDSFNSLYRVQGLIIIFPCEVDKLSIPFIGFTFSNREGKSIAKTKLSIPFIGFSVWNEILSDYSFSAFQFPL